MAINSSDGTNTAQLDYLTVFLGNAASVANIDTTVKSALDRSALRIQIYAQTQELSGNPIKQRSGKLRRHISYEVVKSGAGWVARIGVIRDATDVPYAKWLEGGTKAHIIRPRNKKALAWSKGGGKWSKGGDGMGPFAVVHHPGNRAFRFMRNALQVNRAQTIDDLRRAAAANITRK